MWDCFVKIALIFEVMNFWLGRENVFVICDLEMGKGGMMGRFWFLKFGKRILSLQFSLLDSWSTFEGKTVGCFWFEIMEEVWIHGCLWA